MSLPNTAEIEAASLLAWPAVETLHDGAWVARFANGYTKRANSIQSLDVADHADAGERIEALAEQYRARGLRPTFRITPLAAPAVIAELDARQWDVYETSLVLAMPLRPVGRPVAALTKLFEPTDPQWMEAQGAMAGNDAATQASFAAITAQMTAPTRGILVFDDEYRPVGAALAVNANGIAIFLNVVVAEAARGQGYGRAVMHAALNWTSQSGAQSAAIQVLADNVPAVSLYRSLGFTEMYSYHYRRPQS